MHAGMIMYNRVTRCHYLCQSVHVAAITGWYRCKPVVRHQHSRRPFAHYNCTVLPVSLNWSYYSIAFLHIFGIFVLSIDAPVDSAV